MQNEALALIARLGCALLLTIVIEEAVAMFFFGAGKTGYVLVLLANVATNPVINVVSIWLNMNFHIPPYGIVVIALELAIVWIEYRLISLGLNSRSKRWLILSLAANSASYAAGLFIFKA
jgi:hypothetical protein